MNSLIEKLLSFKNLGKIIFDQKFCIVQLDTRATNLLLLNSKPSSKTNLLELLPELCGSEEILQQILLGNKDFFELNFINRLAEDNSIRYLNLLILSEPEHRQGMVIVEEVSDRARLLQEMKQQRHQLFLYQRMAGISKQFLNEEIIGNSLEIQELRRSVQKLCTVPYTTLLLLGESGTGKNLIAQIIHQNTLSSEAPFIDINCAAIPENLIESELFGFEKGAFTHASASKAGLLEEAEGGTVFLDEIGDLPLNLQAKLLSVIETKKFRRLGSNREIEVKTRFITATNKELASEVAKGKFREDLYHRLNVISLTLPPLRKLGDDIILLAEHFLKIYNFEFKKNVKGFTPKARKMLREHYWPGNVRELSNCMERALIFAEKELLEASDLLIYNPPPPVLREQWKIPSEGISLEEVEKKLIVSALDQTSGNKSKAARLLGLTRDTLRYRMNKHHLL